jgi:hypothetical protein
VVDSTAIGARRELVAEVFALIGALMAIVESVGNLSTALVFMGEFFDIFPPRLSAASRSRGSRCRKYL